MNVSMLILINFVLLAALSKETLALNCLFIGAGGSSVNCDTACSDDGGSTGKCFISSYLANMSQILGYQCDCNNSPACIASASSAEVEGTSCFFNSNPSLNRFFYCCDTDDCNDRGDTSISCVETATTTEAGATQSTTTSTALLNSASKNSLGVFIPVASSILVSFMLF